MNASEYWKLFLETGAPEMYLCYIQAQKTEDFHVSDSAGGSAPSSGLQ